jgi:RHS repeat-associated protein
MTDQATGSADSTQTSYTYGNDVHGSVTQLLDENGGVKASYGYGRQDTKDGDTAGLTTGDTNDLKPFNPYRYAGKRLDSGTAGTSRDAQMLDMGSRRYGLDTGRFLQQDMYADALGDLGLSFDPLTQNRYALAGGNPVSNIELDGHINTEDGGGGATTSGGTSTTSTNTQTTSGTSGGGGDHGGGALDKIGGWFKSGGEKLADVGSKVDSALDKLDARTIENPNWKLYGLYQGWTKFEEKAEPIVGATDIYNCGKDGGTGNCAWAAAAIIPGGKALKGGKALEKGIEAARGSQEVAPRFVYRGGSARPDNLTPRPGKDHTGLSTYDNAAAAAPTGGKVQVIDTTKLKCVIACPDAPPPGHVSLRPPDPSEIPAWAATRQTGQVHRYTQDIMDAIVGQIRLPRP